MKPKFFITVLTDTGELACVGEFEGETIQEAIQQAEEQGRVNCPGRRMITTSASLQEYGAAINWMRGRARVTNLLPAGVTAVFGDVNAPKPFTGLAA